MKRSIDLNADVGEGRGDDALLIPLVTSVNIACGAHAGDESTMAAAVRAAVDAGVAIGAHPGHADREHFGRRELPITAAEASRLITEQVIKLNEVANRNGGAVSYVKLHGALYHQAGRDDELADAVVVGASLTGLDLALLGPAGSALEQACRSASALYFCEAFADRRYARDGKLVPRSEAGAVIEDADRAAAQSEGLAVRGMVTAIDGGPLSVACDSLCVHGDTPRAIEIAKAVRERLEQAGVELRAFASLD